MPLPITPLGHERSVSRSVELEDFCSRCIPSLNSVCLSSA